MLGQPVRVDQHIRSRGRSCQGGSAQKKSKRFGDHDSLLSSLRRLSSNVCRTQRSARSVTCGSAPLRRNRVPSRTLASPQSSILCLQGGFPRRGHDSQTAVVPLQTWICSGKFLRGKLCEGARSNKAALRKFDATRLSVALWSADSSTNSFPEEAPRHRARKLITWVAEVWAECLRFRRHWQARHCGQ